MSVTPMHRLALRLPRSSLWHGIVVKRWQQPNPSARSNLELDTFTTTLPPSSNTKPISTLQDFGSSRPPDEWFLATLTTRPSRSCPQLSLGPNFSDHGGLDPKQPPDERKVKLGKTLRILQERLPTLLQSPLPQEILSPNISLHLFPSTHPHLPVVSGRVAYIAALWTSPIAWNRVPIIGNVRLEVLTARMFETSPVLSTPHRTGAIGEELVVRWRTVGKGSNWVSFIKGGGPGQGARYFTQTEPRRTDPLPTSDDEFTGLFIFSFDKEGRILSHTIEHVDESGHREKGVGAKMVSLTDWLLGGIKRGMDGPIPAAAFSTLCERVNDKSTPRRLLPRSAADESA